MPYATDKKKEKRRRQFNREDLQERISRSHFELRVSDHVRSMFGIDPSRLTSWAPCNSGASRIAGTRERLREIREHLRSGLESQEEALKMVRNELEGGA